MTAVIYRVKKVLNNNVVLATQGFREVIVVGLGVGFEAKQHKAIPTAKIEKVFELKIEDLVKTTQLAQDIPEDVFFELYKAIDDVSLSRGFKLDSHAYITMVDHLYFAMERFRSGQEIHNLMLFDLKILYEDAFTFSQEILKAVNATFNIDLPDDEVGFLTMHVVNGMNQSLNNQSSLLADAVFDCLNIVRDTYLLSLKLDELQTQRIMIHLKMLLIRVMSKTQVDEKEEILFNVMQEFKTAYQCALKIKAYIEERFKTKVNTQELVYLTIHLNRLETTNIHKFSSENN